MLQPGCMKDQTDMTSLPFASGDWNRAAHLRRDKTQMKAFAADANTRVLLMHDGKPLITGETQTAELGPGQAPPEGERQILWAGGPALSMSPKATSLFLGLDEDDAPLFAVDLSLLDAPQIDGAVFEDARAAGASLMDEESRMMATARSIFAWHDKHRYCSNCGTATHLEEAGWKRACAACGTEHFPRVDPVAIMLAVKDDKCLLGRQSNWPRGFWSCLAGFIEPGETPEQGAARELFEEAGIKAASDANYLYCQPWPFASNLMIGLIMTAENTDITVDETEIEHAAWFSREDVCKMLEGTHPDAYLPPKLAVARHIIEHWAHNK